MPGDDQALDFAGAFADGHQARVAVDPFDGVFARAAASAVDLGRASSISLDIARYHFRDKTIKNGSSRGIF